MHIGKTIASAVILGLAVVNWLPIEEFAKATRLLPDNFFTNRSEFQFIDQEIRRSVRRYARSEERDNAPALYSDDAAQDLEDNKEPSVAHAVTASSRARIQSYLSKAEN